MGLDPVRVQATEEPWMPPSANIPAQFEHDGALRYHS